MEIQLLVVLIIAFIILGPERMIDLAVKLGDTLRKVRETWDEIRTQAYMEEINRKVLEQEEIDEPLPDIDHESYNEEEEDREDEYGERTPHDAPHGTSEGTENKTD